MLNLFLAILLKNFEEPPGKDKVEETGPSAFAIFKQLLAKKISSCCTCFGGNENQVLDENNLGDQSPSKSDNVKNLSPIAAEHNPVTPVSKKGFRSKSGGQLSE